MDDETEGSEPGATASLKPSEFSTFVISLGSSVLMSLGHEDPTGGPSMDADLELARQSINILVMLEEKTRGNLTDAEQHLLTGVIYQSRMSYLAAKQGEGGGLDEDGA